MPQDQCRLITLNNVVTSICIMPVAGGGGGLGMELGGKGWSYGVMVELGYGGWEWG